jgi:catechol 2,3-dioxygenase-like lactoylglutathione lyase family enzyme
LNFNSTVLDNDLMLMKCNSIYFLFLVTSGISCFGQSTSSFDPKPYSYAIVVQDIDVSIGWYQSVFGFKLRNRNDRPERGSKIAVLQSGDALLELIEVKTLLSRDSILHGAPERTLIQGFTKIGFKVSNLDASHKRLEESKVKFFGAVYVDSFSKKRSFLISDPDENIIQIFE